MEGPEDRIRAIQEALGARRFAEARAAADSALSAHPGDPQVREAFANVYLAHGIRLSAEARETRRRAIDAHGVPGQPFEDPAEVRSLFEETLAAFDRVLAVDPRHVKAMSLKAQALYRLDRSQRGRALEMYDEALSALEANVPEGPVRETGRRNLLRARARIARPCDWCDETGFCVECAGSGWRRTLGLRRRCEACLGHGVCKRCGIL